MSECGLAKAQRSGKGGWVAVLVATLSVMTAEAQLLISEVMSASSHGNSEINGDWFEILNTSAGVVQLNGFRVDDSATITMDAVALPTYSIAAGETVIVLRENSAERGEAFRAAWSLPATFRIFNTSDFNGASLPGLSSNGETLSLFDAQDMVVDQFTFGTAQVGRSFARFRDGQPIPGGVSTAGQQNAVTSNQMPADTASPGMVATLDTAVPPEFQGPRGFAILQGSEIGQTVSGIPVVDPNAGDTLTLTVVAKPDWLTVGPLMNGAAPLSGVPPTASVGENTLTLRVSDGVAATMDVEENFVIQVVPTSSPLILNEFNGVEPNNFLGGGDATMGMESDAFFGRVEGNGGPWFELVAVGSDASGSLDLRGWTVEISEVDSVTQAITTGATVTFSSSSFWQTVQTGSILAFAQGAGFQTQLNREDRSGTDGWISHHISLADSAQVSLSLVGTTMTLAEVLGNNNTVFTIKNAAGTVVAGPVGEGIGGVSNVSNNDILELRAEPRSSITAFSDRTAILDGYADSGSGSTFGLPNSFTPRSAGPMGKSRLQDFSVFAGSAVSPFAQFLADQGITNDPTGAGDPDGDGFSTREEYFFGGDPNEGSSFPTTEVEGLVFEFHIREDETSRLVLEESANLQQWTPINGNFSRSEIVSPTGSDYRRVTVTLSAPNGARFLRFAETSSSTTP